MKVKHRRKRANDLGRRSSEASRIQQEEDALDMPSSMDGMMGLLFQTVLADTCQELIATRLLRTLEGELLLTEEKGLLMDEDAVLKAYRELRESKKDDESPTLSIEHWVGLKLMSETGDVWVVGPPVAEVDPDSYKRAAELLASLVSPMFHPSLRSSSAPSAAGASDLSIDAEEVKNMLPPTLASSPLFMNIVNMVSTELSQSGVMKELEQTLLNKQPEATSAAEEQQPVDDGLGELPPMPESVAKAIEAEMAKRKSGKGISPEMLMKLSESVMGGKGLGSLNGGLAEKLKGMAQKIGEQVKEQVQTNQVSPDDIKRDFTAALEFISNMGLPGAGDVLKTMKPEPVD